MAELYDLNVTVTNTIFQPYRASDKQTPIFKL